MGMKNYFT